MNTTAISQQAPGAEPQSTITAFCAGCPDPQEVTRLLQGLGFHLVFSMPAEPTAAYVTGLPPLPAQYHYEDSIGTRVEYLAGVDTPCLADEEDDGTLYAPYFFPPHLSRFWLTQGGQEFATIRARGALADAFGLRWLDRLPAPASAHVA